MDWGPVTGWIAGAVGIIGVAWTVYKDRVTRSKHVYWKITADARVMDQSNAHWGSVKVTLNGSDVAEPRIVTVELTNAGANAVKADEISIPAQVLVDKGMIVAAAIYNVSSNSGSRRQILVASSLPADKVEAEKSLLNPGDSISFQLLVDGYDAKVQPDFDATDFKFRELPRKEFSEIIANSMVARLPWPISRFYELLFTAFGISSRR